MGNTAKTSKIVFKRLLYGGVTLLWMALIFFFSSQNGQDSTNSSFNVTTFILDALTQLGIISACNITAKEFLQVEDTIRTFAHFLEYLILGALTFQFFCYTDISNKKTFLNLAVPFVICGLYALTDETHQFFVPGRAMQLIDWLVDAAGIICGVVILFLITKNKKRKI